MASPPPHWFPFIGFVVALAVVAVWLARRSAEFVRDGEVPPPSVLYLNVVGTQALVVALVVIAGWLAAVPEHVFALRVSPFVVGAGLVVGAVVFTASVIVTRALSSVGITYSEALRNALEPRTPSQTVLLYGATLPAVAVGEELLFRGALIGAIASGLDISPWLPAIASSALFGYAHSAQGKAGVVVTGVLGFVLAGLFILTDSLLAVVVAHFVVNALEFAFGPRLTQT